MIERYTASARQAMSRALAHAGRGGAERLSPEHILLGLLDEGSIAPVLAARGVDPAAVRAGLEVAAARSPSPVAPPSPPFTPDATSALAWAAVERDRRAASEASASDLLLGIAREGKSPAARVLSGFGLGVREIRRAVALGKGRGEGRAGSVFATGATGFLGSRVVDRLRRRGPWRSVRALARSPEGEARVRALRVEPIPGSLADAAGAWRGALAGAPWVVHCAQPSVLAGEDPRGRAAMDAHLLEALDAGEVERAVLVFGSSYYGASAGGASVDETTRPRRPVGIGRTFEPGVESLAARRRDGLDAVAAFPAAIYGRGSWFLEAWLAALRAGEPIPVADPAPRWTWIHVDDCARAIEHLLTAPDPPDEVILGAGEPVALDRFLEALGEAAGVRPNLVRLSPEAMREALPPIAADYFTADMPHSAGRLAGTGFEPEYPTIDAGLASLGLRDR